MANPYYDAASSLLGYTMPKFHQHSTLLKHFGFKKVKTVTGPNPAAPKLKNALITTLWKHKTLGFVKINHLQHTFVHRKAVEQEPEQGWAILTIGKDNVFLQNYLNGEISPLTDGPYNEWEPPPLAFPPPGQKPTDGPYSEYPGHPSVKIPPLK